MRPIAGIALACAALAGPAAAQSISGTIKASKNGMFAEGSFECSGQDPCTGTYRAIVSPEGCPPHSIADRIVITGGVTPPSPGPVSLTVRLVNADEDDPMRCVWRTTGDVVFLATGSWNGAQGTFTGERPELDGIVHFQGSYALDKPPPFQMTVTSDITATAANATATVKFPDAVVGTNQGVYVFALAPASLVKRATGEKADLALPCVLARLNEAGQLVSVSASSLQAYVTGVLAAGNQAYTILNGVPTVNISGATFFLGYGTSASSMISGGTNRAAVTVPASSGSCRAEKPQTGWWWNDQEGGRGFSIEARNGNLFFAGFLYDATGQATWLAAAGPTTLEGSVFQGSLLAFANGQSMTGTYRAPAAQPSPGAITLTFSDAQNGVLSWPGGNIGIKRFEIAAAGLSLAPVANQPESGWWWNEAESGRGYFIEWQGANAFLATYLYTTTGSPVWYASQGATPDISRFTGSLLQYTGGQTLTGPYRAPTSSTSVGNVGVTFTGTDTATLTWPGGTQVPIKRFRF